MTDICLPILSSGGLEFGWAPERADLRALLKAELGKPVRRIGRFIQLALIGGHRAIGDTPLPDDTNIYLTSGSGDMDVTIDVLERIVREGHAPKPLTFINTVSNAACFYLAKQFGVAGSSTFISSRGFALETALRQALLDAQVLSAESALVGSVDILTEPEHAHRLRLGLTPQDAHLTLAEGTHWFRFGSLCPANALQDNAPGAIGALQDIRLFTELSDVLAWRDRLASRGAPLHMAFGALLPTETQNALQQKTDAQTYAPQQAPKGFYHTQVGTVLRDFLERTDMPAARLLHVQTNDAGAYCAVLVSRSAPQLR